MERQPHGSGSVDEESPLLDDIETSEEHKAKDFQVIYIPSKEKAVSTPPLNGACTS